MQSGPLSSPKERAQQLGLTIHPSSAPTPSPTRTVASGRKGEKSFGGLFLRHIHTLCPSPGGPHSCLVGEVAQPWCWRRSNYITRVRGSWKMEGGAGSAGAMLARMPGAGVSGGCTTTPRASPTRAKSKHGAGQEWVEGEGEGSSRKREGEECGVVAWPTQSGRERPARLLPQTNERLRFQGSGGQSESEERARLLTIVSGPPSPSCWGLGLGGGAWGKSSRDLDYHRSCERPRWRLPGVSTGRISERAAVVAARGDAREGYRMATHTYVQSDPSPEEIKLGRLRTSDLVKKNLWRLSKTEQITYTYGPLFLATNSSLSGFLANYFFRRYMKVKQHPFKTFVPLSAIPFLTTEVTYKFLVTDPLSSGDLTADMSILRGACVSVLCGIFHPSALAFLKNGRLAVKYETVPLPPRGRSLHHWTTFCQPAARLMIIPMIIQIVSGGYLASMQHEICERIFEMLEHD
ncbi:uncharacterized protein LOC110213419 [Phascolarctos cinereus]|uniref:Uncharacterized protein LOC110213419 n=1 Tax=Phascolarctos cinereus TaxID=38626 RepID=A0A6P5KXV9_PHACI|nr:uncharacterized protein LOC110213419 [Phascolarctos cinereus]